MNTYLFFVVRPLLVVLDDQPERFPNDRTKREAG